MFEFRGSPAELPLCSPEEDLKGVPEANQLQHRNIAQAQQQKKNGKKS